MLSDEHAEDFFIGGVVDREDKALVLYRGNLEPLLVPLDWFRAKPRRPEPDFDALALTDSGNTVQLGEYEAGTDAILYEFDPEARPRLREREIRKDESFGGSLRRLRLQKGLSRSDFAPLSSKTIARLERGEVEGPHGDTLEAILVVWVCRRARSVHLGTRVPGALAAPRSNRTGARCTEAVGPPPLREEHAARRSSKHIELEARLLVRDYILELPAKDGIR